MNRLYKFFKKQIKTEYKNSTKQTHQFGMKTIDHRQKFLSLFLTNFLDNYRTLVFVFYNYFKLNHLGKILKKLSERANFAHSQS